jgi:hypothetical protein
MNEQQSFATVDLNVSASPRFAADATQLNQRGEIVRLRRENLLNEC